MPSVWANHASRYHWRTSAHLDRLTEALIALAGRRIRRLIVEMPPRHGKSELCSGYFPAWYLGTFPDHRVIVASYEHSFASSWTERAKGYLAEYGREVFGVDVNMRRGARDNWRLQGRRGQCVAAGAGGSLTGRGADVLIIDDPVKNAREANSPVIRQAVWDWYASTARTRLEPDGVVIVIMARWHQDDLVGRLLDSEAHGGERWTRLRLPAIAEANDLLGRHEGEALWPERFPVSELQRIRQSIGSYWWNALYQQRPQPAGGLLFRTEWFTVLPTFPRDVVARVRYWDCAGTAGGGDYTVGTRIARLRSGLYVVEHVVRGQWSARDVENVMLQTARVDGRGVAIREEQEGGSAGKAICFSHAKMLAGFDYRGVVSTGDKETRWRPFAAQAEAGNVAIVAGPWNGDWLDELVSVPTARHDDQADSASGAFTELAMRPDTTYELAALAAGENDTTGIIMGRVF